MTVRMHLKMKRSFLECDENVVVGDDDDCWPKFNPYNIRMQSKLPKILSLAMLFVCSSFILLMIILLVVAIIE